MENPLDFDRENRALKPCAMARIRSQSYFRSGQLTTESDFSHYLKIRNSAKARPQVVQA